MICIFCGNKTAVANSRFQRRQLAVWRRRNCRACGLTFTTQEKVNYSLSSLKVLGAKGALEPFSETKLLLSLYGSLSHRKSAAADAKALTDTVISQLLPARKSIEVRDITSTAYKTLKKFDLPGSTYYKAHYC